MLKSSMIKIILPQPSTRYYHAWRAQQHEKEPAAAFGVGIVHHVFAAKAANPNDTMDPEVRVHAINKEDRGLSNRGAFSLVQVDAVHSHAKIIDTCIITRPKHFGTVDEETKARLIIQRCQDAE
jgi:hypothetical protein